MFCKLVLVPTIDEAKSRSEEEVFMTTDRLGLSSIKRKRFFLQAFRVNAYVIPSAILFMWLMSVQAVDRMARKVTHDKSLEKDLKVLHLGAWPW